MSRFGDIFTDDRSATLRDLRLPLANPPFGVDWKKQQREIAGETRVGKGASGPGCRV
jgi:type I restriction enzyme M protein